MKISSMTLFFSLLSLLAIWYTLNSLKKESMGIRSAVAWLLLWFGIGFFSLFPSLLNSVMRLSQMENRMFFILVLAVFILFALVFNLSSRIDRMQTTLARLVQEMAIMNYKVNGVNETKGKAQN